MITIVEHPFLSHRKIHRVAMRNSKNGKNSFEKNCISFLFTYQAIHFLTTSWGGGIKFNIPWNLSFGDIGCKSPNLMTNTHSWGHNTDLASFKASVQISSQHIDKYSITGKEIELEPRGTLSYWNCAVKKVNKSELDVLHKNCQRYILNTWGGGVEIERDLWIII